MNARTGLPVCLSCHRQPPCARLLTPSLLALVYVANGVPVEYNDERVVTPDAPNDPHDQELACGASNPYKDVCVTTPSSQTGAINGYFGNICPDMRSTEAQTTC